MEKNSNTSELELMRQQMAEFKQQLEQQSIVNDRMIAESMKKKMSWIKRFVMSEVIALPAIIAILIGVKYMYDLSWWGIGSFCALGLFDTWFDYRTNVQCMNESDYSRDNLVYTMEKLADMKQRRGVEIGIMGPATVFNVLWIGLEISDTLTTRNAGQHEWLILYSAGIGALAGLALAVWIYFKMQKTNDELMRQIEEMTEDLQ